MNKRYLVNTIAIAVLIFIITDCGGGGGTGKKVKYPGEVTPQIEAAFNQIEEQYRRRNYEYAFSGYQNFIQSYAYNRLTDESYYKQGKIFFLTSRYLDAAQKFTELADKSPNPVYQARAWHMVGYANFKMGRYETAVDVLKNVEAEALNARMRVQYYSLAIKSAQALPSQVDFANHNMLYLYSLYEEYAGENLKSMQGGGTIDYQTVKGMVDAWLSQPMTSAQIPDWMRKFPASSAARAYVDYKTAMIYHAENNTKKAQRLFASFVKRYPKNPLAPQARQILATLGAEVDTDDEGPGKGNYKVGVLLPLVGRHETYGQSVLDGVRCAAGQNNVCGDFSGIELVVSDPGETPESVRKAIQDLAAQNVVAIIGPLSGQTAVDAGLVATEQKIPIFPITQKENLMSQGNYIFQVGLQPKQQIQALVKAARDKGLKSFGVFYPDNNYGQVMADLFSEEVKAAGGKITATAQYSRRSADILAEGRKLKTSIGSVATPDVGVGFDALFIPDSYQMINVLISALEYNSITGIPLLGTNAWNDPGLSLAIADKFPGSFFVDLYDGAADTKEVKEFKEKFVAGFGRSPRVLEAYGYDVMMMIRSLSADKGEQHIKESLDGQFPFKGVTGIRGFKTGESTVIESMVLKVGTDGVQE
ncbi:MAG: penicillin-binding protein activator [Deltaproteobacteria bacterium]|nr:penicillin-binding protein activator [Deltaproteobacteria bacterium]